MRYTRAYLDADGVVGDFDRAVFSVFGLDSNFDQVKSWDGHAKALTLLLGREVTTSEMWEKIAEQGFDFWANLPLLPWAHDLFTICKENCKEVVMMTSPTNPARRFAAGGKLEWLEKHFPDADGYILTDKKYLAAKAGYLLIDDNEIWCKEFEERGGSSYCFPCSHNCKNWKSRDPLREIEDILSSGGRFSI